MTAGRLVDWQCMFVSRTLMFGDGGVEKTKSFGSDFVLTKVSPVIFSVVSVDTGDPDSCYFTFLEWA